MEGASEINLNEEIVMEILLRLPVKSLIKFNCVCRGWRDLINSRHFINMHLCLAQSTEYIIVKRLRDEDNKNVLSFHSPADESLLAAAPELELPELDEANWPLQLIGPCNGIVCLRDFHEGIHLCNPMTRKFRTLPQSSFGSPGGFLRQTHVVGLGFDSTIDGYKVVRIFESSLYDFRAEIYNLSTNSWRQVDAILPPVILRDCFDLLFNGFFHWSAGPKSSPHILSFDTGAEVFKEIKYPNGWLGEQAEPRSVEHSLVVLDDSMALILFSRGRLLDSELYDKSEQYIEIWAMMEYGVEESWVKKFFLGPFSGIQCVLSFWSNDKLLADCCKQLVSFGIQNDSKLKKYDIKGFYLQLVILKEISHILLKSIPSTSNCSLAIRIIHINKVAMLAEMFKLLILILALCPSAIDSSFQYFNMVEQWPGGYCQFHRCRRVPWPNDFTIHGLWPANHTGTVENCKKTGFAPIQDENKFKQLDSIWPDLDQPRPE
ncbi:unnamed protein product [Coffea canephora]|uniref:F-box domain-containing protein n=1 Tax=Coffea canephora TaxID=49390 RepID=A0A068V6Z2_COFCA|nr:unnamed protein product [Coffea canephora]